MESSLGWTGSFEILAKTLAQGTQAKTKTKASLFPIVRAHLDFLADFAHKIFLSLKKKKKNPNYWRK